MTAIESRRTARAARGARKGRGRATTEDGEQTAFTFAERDRPEHAERSVIGCILANPSMLRHCAQLAPEHFFAPKARFTFEAMRQLADEGVPIDRVSVEARLERLNKLEVVGVAFLGECGLTRAAPTPEAIEPLIRDIWQAATNREAAVAMSEALEAMKLGTHEPAEALSEIRGELERFESEHVSSNAPRGGYRLMDILKGMSADGAPHIPLTLGGGCFADLYEGGVCVLMGATGSGKTTMALALALEHAKKRGPVLYASYEVDRQRTAARVAGMLRLRSWSAALCSPHEIAEGIDRDFPAEHERFRLLDDKPDLRLVESTVRDLRDEFPGQPVLVVFDQLQNMPLPVGDGSKRPEDALVEELRIFVNKHRLYAIEVSQVSRNNGVAIARGDKIGRAAADAGAGSSEIERAAEVTLTLGESTDAIGDDGQPYKNQLVSVGKNRLGDGDKVVECHTWPATGTYRVGEPRATHQVLAEANTKRAEKARSEADMRVRGAARKLAKPVTKTELAKAAGGKAAHVREAIERLIEAGELVESPLPRRGRGDGTGWSLPEYKPKASDAA